MHIAFPLNKVSKFIKGNEADNKHACYAEFEMHFYARDRFDISDLICINKTCTNNNCIY